MQTSRWLDWIALLALVITFGSAFLLTKIAVQDFPALLVVAGRIMIGALVLIPLVYLQGERFSQLKPYWPLLTVLAITGNCTPFFLITWGQQYIDSGLAGILMAMMPLATILLAHLFVADERITRHKLLGFVLGFVGVVILMLPEMRLNNSVSWLQILAMLSVLSGAVSYAVNSVVAHRLPHISLTLLSAGVLVIASILIAPFALLAGLQWSGQVSASSLVAIGLLGLFPSGLATIVYFSLIRRAGAPFMSQANYLIPVWAVFIGVVIGQEHISLHAMLALVVILAGIALAQKSPVQ